MESRLAKISVCGVGGTAGKGSKTYKLSLPSTWVAAMKAAGGDGRVILSFDGEEINVRPKQSADRYRASRLARGHKLLEIRYFNGKMLSTLIYADRTVRDLSVENYTDQTVKTAFGKNQNPSWEDLEAFLEERCIPRRRSGLREYLETLGLDEYDPLAIIRKTGGRMAEDDQWMEVREIR